MITKIDHVGIVVENLEEFSNFFIEVLDLSVRERFVIPESGTKVVGLRVGENAIELMKRPPEPYSVPSEKLKIKGITHIGLTTDNIEEDLAKLKGSETKLLHKEPRTAKVGEREVRLAFFEGPEGVLFELMEWKE